MTLVAIVVVAGLLVVAWMLGARYMAESICRCVEFAATPEERAVFDRLLQRALRSRR